MARRKATNVQRNLQQLKRKQREEETTAADASARAGENADVSDDAWQSNDKVEIVGAPYQTQHGAPKKTKKRRTQANSGDQMFVNSNAQPLQLSCFESENTNESNDKAVVFEREEALWLAIPLASANDKVTHTLIQFLDYDEPSSKAPIGLEIAAHGSQVLLRSIVRSNSCYQTRMATDLTLADFFLGTFTQWIHRLVYLAQSHLLAIEIHKCNSKDKEEDINSKAKQQKKRREKLRFEWRVGINWRRYMTLCEHNLPMTPLPQILLHRSMHDVMIWLLKHVDRHTTQVSYMYWKEIDVLYTRFVGEITGLENTTFDIHDIYMRIDSNEHLQRDSTSVEHALASDCGGSRNLLPTLRQYQKAAVSWMLAREKPEQVDEEDTISQAIYTCVEFGKLTLAGMKTSPSCLLYDPFCGAFHCSRTLQVQDQEEEAKSLNTSLNLSNISGGILADEMGLGKTVEVITLVLCHPNPNSEPILQTSHRIPEYEPKDENNQEMDIGNDKDIDIQDCICGSSAEHELGWVQCDFCKTWHHQICTGYNTQSKSFQVASNGLYHTKSKSNSFSSNLFMCFHCQIHEKPQFACKTTLIVSPESIHNQWELEFKRHVKPGALKLLRYPGVKALRSRLATHGPCAEWQVLASGGLHLASYDIVLTTYEALASDLHHLPTENGRDRRSSTRQKRKRYAFVASPLVFLRFWRVCMDEAQVGAENTRLQSALTVAEIQTQMKWVVTGTPFSTQIGDLFGCFKFLRVPPFAQKWLGERFFRVVIEQSFSKGAVERVLDMLLWDGKSYQSGGDGCSHIRKRTGGGILWRTSKQDVLDQLGLPVQKSEVVWCQFSKVERHFYEEQEKRIIALVREQQRQQQQQDKEHVQTEPDDLPPKMERYKGEDAEVADTVWRNVLRLRQICCHPQVGSALHTALAGRGKFSSTNVLTMDEFLHELIVKSKRDCEEAQRKFLAAQNGLASLLVIMQDVPAAILKYLVSIQTVNSNWSLYRADLLPRLHIVENLARCVRSIFEMESDGLIDDETTPADGTLALMDGIVVDQNPKKESLLPNLPTLQQRLTAGGIDSDEMSATDRAAIIQECALLDACGTRIKRFYLFQVESSHTAALRLFTDVKAAVDKELPVRQQLLCSSSMWWNDALVLIDQIDPEQAEIFIDRLRARLQWLGTKWAIHFSHLFTSIRGLRLMLVTELEELHKKRVKLIANLLALSDDKPSKKQVELSGNCKKCRDGRDGPVCAHCNLYKDLDAYKQHFLGIDKSTPAKNNGKLTDVYQDDFGQSTGATAVGTAASSLLLDIFKEIAASARAILRKSSGNTTGFNREMVTLATLHDHVQKETEFWTQLQREWTAAKKLFQVQHQRLGSLDELEMASTQIRLRLADEAVASVAEQLYKIEEYEIPTRFEGLEVDRVVAEQEMRETNARLRYLLELEKQRSNDGDDTTDMDTRVGRPSISKRIMQSCAVCLEPMDKERAVLPCAHTFCKSCIKALPKPSRMIKCPTCRRTCTNESVVTVLEEVEAPSEQGHRLNSRHESSDEKESNNKTARLIADAHIPLERGGFGSKIDAILRRVVALANRKNDVKCLLFTQWPEILTMLAIYLPQNGTRCFVYTTKKQFHHVLQQFKHCSDPCVLALPYKVGANGLNVIEATEVLLIEPLLNKSMEAQAINRVHRIGQTKPTRVHRFIVSDSVEERILWLGRKRTMKNGSRRQTRNSSRENGQAETIHQADEEIELVAECVPGKKEKERLTLNDLDLLLDGKTEAGERHHITEMDISEKANGDGANHTAIVRHTFWQEQVNVNGKVLGREEARSFLERRHAVDLRARHHHRMEDEPQTRLFGESVNVVVANELLVLPYADDNDDRPTRHISSQLLEFHQTRVQEEFQVWMDSRMQDDE